MPSIVLATIYGRDIHYAAPDVHTAQLVDDGQRIALTFAHVSDRIDSTDQAANCFVVEDEAGMVPLAQVEYPMDATIQLELTRALVGRAVVHGAFGYDPPLAPVDMNRLMPMLSFYGVPVS